MENIYYQRIKEVVSAEVWERIEILQPKTLVEFSAIFGMGPVTLERISEEVQAIEAEYLASKHTDLNPELKLRLEILRDRLINISQRNNIIWNTKEQNNKLIDLSKLNKSSIDSIYKIVNNPKKEVELVIDGLDREEQKEVFLSIFRENERQKMEKGRSILYVTPAMFLGKIKIENKDVRLRAPLFLFPVELILNKATDKWFLQYDNSRDVVTNPFVERYVLKDIKEFNYDFDLTLEENIVKLSNFGKKISVQYSELEHFSKVTTKDSWPYMNGEFAIVNNLLVGLFSDFSNEIEAELEHLIYHMDSTPMLSRFLSNEDFHSRDVVQHAKTLIESKINNDTTLTYTNKLNEQQLRALKLINEPSIDGLTIWGPPGTGKSETIISIIEDAIAKGKKVAVVSEKQAALDVIKNRLKVMEDNSIMISDTKDKLGFFKQLSKMLERDYYNHEVVVKKTKTQLKTAYHELDIIYEKFGFNNKNIFQQVEEMFNKPLYETPLSKRMQYEDQFYFFKNITLESFTEVFEFIESIDSRDRLKLLIAVSNNYYSKFKSFVEVREFISKKIRDEVEYIRMRNELIDMTADIKRQLESYTGFFGFFKKIFYKNDLKMKYGLEKQDFKDIFLGTFIGLQRLKIDSSNDLKDKLILELDWVEARRYDIDVCLGMDVNNLNLIRLIDIDDIPSTKEAIKINLIRRLLKSEQFIEKMDILRKYEDKLNHIRELQEQFAQLSHEEVSQTLDKNLSKVTLNKRENNMLKIANRKRPIAIRKFMMDYSVEVKSLVNVWLLQPEVIPALFDLQDEFDVVIFDEASQVFLERSLPAIARAKKLVVLGDEKQLGPSSFFAGRINSEEKEDEALEENESLLTYARSKLPEIMLKKHYRSKDLNLIKFSSDRYYEGGLDFINDNEFHGESLKYYFVSDSDYSDGQNKKEAHKVIEILQKLKDLNSTDSIGVITANSKQEVYIFNQLITKHYDLFEWLKDGNSFIKSIENVQGDERDIIIFSTTYGPEDGNQRINFGPINQALGSNRINVAVTRSKKKMIVVSSIDIEQAKSKVQNSLHAGPKDFIDYIEYVKNVSEGKIKRDEMNTSDFDTPFKTEVVRTLGEIVNHYNLEMKTNYEGLGHTLDIVIYDPHSNRNLLAILLDSPEDTKLAREKDYLAQEFLEARGWKVHRIWSPNWWTRNTKEVSMLEELLQEATRGEDNE